MSAAATTVTRVRRSGTWGPVFRDMLRLRRAKVGIVLVGLVVGAALLGPLFAPYSPTELTGRPLQASGAGAALGTDALGRDVLSRFLHGGAEILLIALLATVLGVAVGLFLGVIAGSSRAATDETVMRTLDIILSFPAIVLPLLVISILGRDVWLVVLTIAVLHAPYVARVVRVATMQIIELDFMHYAEGLGTSRRRMLLGDVLPNITGPLAVEFGVRMTYSIALVAALAYLGFGAAPPAADWGTMIQENQIGLSVNPWPVLLPVIAIALLTIGLNLLTDAFSRASAGIDRELVVQGQEPV